MNSCDVRHDDCDGGDDDALHYHDDVNESAFLINLRFLNNLLTFLFYHFVKCNAILNFSETLQSNSFTFNKTHR